MIPCDRRITGSDRADRIIGALRVDVKRQLGHGPSKAYYRCWLIAWQLYRLDKLIYWHTQRPAVRAVLRGQPEALIPCQD